MLKEFLDSLWTKARDSMTPTILPLGQPSHLKTVAMPDGSLLHIRNQPEPRDHEPLSLAALVKALHESIGEDPATNAVIWFSRHGVIGFYDDGDRRDQLRLELAYSTQINTLMSLEKNRTAFDQKAFIQLLRINFHKCLGAAANLLTLVRSVKFVLNQQAETTVQTGKQSMGKQLMAELTNSDRLPEEISLFVPVFVGPCGEHEAHVVCALDVDPASEKFYLIPLPGQIEGAIQYVEDKIRQQLQALTAELDPAILYFYGKP